MERFLLSERRVAWQILSLMWMIKQVLRKPMGTVFKTLVMIFLVMPCANTLLMSGGFNLFSGEKLPHF
ncbi:hypothetical protein QJS10_CPA02g01606 [Acorus calamus]|uniref:Uncharacterized protein n=1 Tax=Acorus calamus TaxID=4465 RepID=A0AAV9FCB3_ACOCL|nr:hypothetical protein QJS10_CPA02g01606 [Acorus calamus]